ncbi:winged helix-turn-helix transcriptional regulator [Chlamydia pecorum]|uniref:Transcriptional regulator n=1 Tax=Chlamydia pecorum (strain ATCC VR-628 / DSM 29919 / E58) TaxID=331635 RepID=A0AA34RCR7_CHLPE|nr:transcriptional regulator [Chlamydia pecorum E58]AGW39355.1 transcriptional regulator [Chlamydia pecorum W73]ETF38655.1 transcriptional regulator [Chlamydia pecorum VR629]UJT76678.1 transcriptional regulator [Chlamydia pecorum]
MNKTILLVTKDHSLSLELKNLCSYDSPYHLVISPSFSMETSASVIFCEYLLLPETIFSHKFSSQSDLIVLFDLFSEESVVEVLDKGATGYLLRPLTAKVMDAVIRAFLRHNSSTHPVVPETLHFGDRTFHVLSLTIESPEGKTHLTPSEAGILKRLLMNQGQLCLRKHLLEEIKGNIKEITPRNVDVHIASLRKKLGPYGSKISTIRGIGYLFATEDSQEFLS